MTDPREQSVEEWLSGYEGQSKPVTEPDHKRGVIVHRERRKQIMDFSGLRFVRGITPTDIDFLNGYEVTGAIEFNNEYFIFIECKYNNKSIDKGQKMALERCVDAIYSGGKKSILIICDHFIHNTNEDVDVSACIVREVRVPPKQTVKPARQLQVRECINIFTKNIYEPSIKAHSNG